mgnify:FL=1
MVGSYLHRCTACSSGVLFDGERVLDPAEGDSVILGELLASRPRSAPHPRHEPSAAQSTRRTSVRVAQKAGTRKSPNWLMKTMAPTKRPRPWRTFVLAARDSGSWYCVGMQGQLVLGGQPGRVASALAWARTMSPNEGVEGWIDCGGTGEQQREPVYVYSGRRVRTGLKGRECLKLVRGQAVPTTRRSFRLYRRVEWASGGRSASSLPVRTR